MLLNMWPLLVLMVILAPIYFLPSIIAYKRTHHNFIPILIVNFLFGWSLVGLIVCLVWSLTSVSKRADLEMAETDVSQKENVINSAPKSIPQFTGGVANLQSHQNNSVPSNQDGGSSFGDYKKLIEQSDQSKKAS